MDMMDMVVIAVLVMAGAYAVVRMYRYKRERNAKAGTKSGAGFPTKKK